MIKLVITGGCSFSNPLNPSSWIHKLEKKILELYPKVSFRHTGYLGQGQNLIQKKISLALTEELQNYSPDEILVLPMWSGTERTAFWIDSKDYIKEIIEKYPDVGFNWGLQFADLHNKQNGIKIDKESYLKKKYSVKNNNDNLQGGWYICNFISPDSKLSEEYLKSSDTIIGFATTSLENIIFLQNLCKVHKVKMFHSFYRNYVYNDFYLNKDHNNLNYLYNMLDHDMIISTQGMYEHLRPNLELSETSNIGGMFKYTILKFMNYKDESSIYFKQDNWHPNQLGAQKWVDEVLFPKLKEHGVF